MINVRKFSTKDFYIASILLASKKLVLRGLKKINDKTVTFIFDDPNLLAEKLIEEHWNRKNKIPTRDLIEAINELKTRIYSVI